MVAAVVTIREHICGIQRGRVRCGFAMSIQLLH